jgi:hypothetical protein
MITFGTGGRNGSERVDDLIGIGIIAILNGYAMFIEQEHEWIIHF